MVNSNSVTAAIPSPVHETASPQVIVVQIGARHNYAVPAAFERLGMLDALYTDLCGRTRLSRYTPGPMWMTASGRVSRHRRLCAKPGRSTGLACNSIWRGKLRKALKFGLPTVTIGR